MRLILQRVSSAAVTVDGRSVGAIGRGMVVLVGCERGDSPAEARAAADRLAALRIFADEAGKMNLDSSTAGGEFLVVSQFTLLADLDRGRRPSFGRAERPELAGPLVDRLVEELRGRGFRVATGEFRAAMQVELVNDGPVTFVLDLAPRAGGAPRAG